MTTIQDKGGDIIVNVNISRHARKMTHKRFPWWEANLQDLANKLYYEGKSLGDFPSDSKLNQYYKRQKRSKKNQRYYLYIPEIIGIFSKTGVLITIIPAQKYV